METIKSFTDLSQSKTLSKILPLESADMYYSHEFVNSAGDYYKLNIASEGYFDDKELLGSDIPCWSLAALLSVIPSRLFDSTPKRKELYLLPDLDKSYCFYRQFAVKTKGKIYLLTEGECLVDACYEMILKLHELKNK